VLFTYFSKFLYALQVNIHAACRACVFTLKLIYTSSSFTQATIVAGSVDSATSIVLAPNLLAQEIL
jgi:hypothetical protein